MKDQFMKGTNMVIKKFIIIFFILFTNTILLQTNLYSFENKIIFKIENQIITSIDIKNEIKYLIALNPSLKKLNKSEITEISKKSLLNEKIKRIEIAKQLDAPKIPEDFLRELIKNIYTKIGIKELRTFKEYLKSNDVSYEDVLLKIETEALWNELIVLKFSNKLKINEKEIQKQIEKDHKQTSKSYLLSEIFFEVLQNEKVDQKFIEISNAINQIGFDNAALKYSISESSSLGGKLDWIDENSLNEKIKSQLNSKGINEITSPIAIPGGFLILQINNIKEIKSKKLNIENELKKYIRASKNAQFNQFSKIYFGRIKKDMEINEI